MLQRFCCQRTKRGRTVSEHDRRVPCKYSRCLMQVSLSYEVQHWLPISDMVFRSTRSHVYPRRDHCTGFPHISNLVYYLTYANSSVSKIMMLSLHCLMYVNSSPRDSTMFYYASNALAVWIEEAFSSRTSIKRTSNSESAPVTALVSSATPFCGPALSCKHFALTDGSTRISTRSRRLFWADLSTQ